MEPNDFSKMTHRPIEGSPDKVVLDVYVEWKLHGRFTVWQQPGNVVPSSTEEIEAYVRAKAANYWVLGPQAEAPH
jgi:hypothetical protein